ncbi:phosphotransferase [Streptomyces sp. NBC_01089]|uniref:phosphotransferase n=1 Tax=Streptomyces sp. NBC_01089 TaxID=2903747 RepID=UPI00386E11F9
MVSPPEIGTADPAGGPRGGASPSSRLSHSCLARRQRIRARVPVPHPAVRARSSPRRLRAEVTERLIPVLEHQRGLDIDPQHCWSQYARDRLAGGWDHARKAMASPGPQGLGFVASIDALFTSFGQVELPTGDLVHGDFRLDNILLGSNRVAAVIDIEALGSGTRAFDYATLLTVDDVDPAGWELTRLAGEQVAGPGVLAHCFALVALDLADFVRQRVPERLPFILGPLRDRAEALLP